MPKCRYTSRPFRGPGGGGAHGELRRGPGPDLPHLGKGLRRLTGEQHGAPALGGVQRQLVEGEDLAARLEDAAAGATGHTQGAHLGRGSGSGPAAQEAPSPQTPQPPHLELGHLQHAHVVGDSPHNHSCLVFPAWQLHLPDLECRGGGLPSADPGSRRTPLFHHAHPVLHGHPPSGTATGAAGWCGS